MENWEHYFDEEFTKEEPINSYVPDTNKEIVDEYQTEFDGFSYNPNMPNVQATDKNHWRITIFTTLQLLILLFYLVSYDIFRNYLLNQIYTLLFSETILHKKLSLFQ